MRLLSAVRLGAPAAFALLAACGGEKTSPPPPVSVSSAAPTASASAPAAPEAAPSPLSVVLESSAPIVFSGLANGVWIGHSGRAQVAQAAAGKDLAEAKMPSGLPDGPGQLLRASGRLPGSIWLSFQELREDGTPGAAPLYRLGQSGWKRVAEDWEPHIAAWSKNRLLAASTSSGRLKVKVMEPQVAEAPPDLPGARFDDETCARSFKLRELAALPSGEVLAAGNCTPDGEKGARYVVIRWAGTAGAVEGASPPTRPSGGATPGGVDSSSSESSEGADAGAPADAGADASPVAPTSGEAAEGVPGTVSVIPGATRNLGHRALHARSATEVYAAAVDEAQGAGHLARFDGAAWSVEPLPPGAEPVRALAGTSDGSLWMITEHQIWKRAPSGTWEQVPPPNGAFPEPDPVWELQGLWAGGTDEVWIAARHSSKASSRYLVLRSKPAAAPIRWQ